MFIVNMVCFGCVFMLNSLCVFQLCVPLALFFVTGDKKFVPIAIQLYQHIAPNNPVTHCTLNAGSRCMSDVKLLSPKVLCVHGTEHSLDV